MNMESVRNKVVVITGASAGIGAGIAKLFAKYGAKLVIGGRDETRLQKTADCCQEEGLDPAHVLCVTGDLTKEETCLMLVDKAVEKFGHLDVVVNNAGAHKESNSESLSVQDLDYMYNVLLRAPFLVTQRAIPHLKKSKGCIVNISSCICYMPEYSGYMMMKAALTQFTRNLAQELGESGVRVNCVKPGSINTHLLQEVKETGVIKTEAGEDATEDQLLEMVVSTSALKRIGEVNDVAQLVVFLSSDAASFLTGSDVLIDGGFTTFNPFKMN